MASYVLAFTFVWAGAAKVLGFPRWRLSLERFGLSRGAGAAAVAVPAVELGVAVLLLTAFREIGAALTLALLGGFSFAILVAARKRGSRLPCGCFGSAKERDYRWMLVRNGALAVLAAVVLFGRQARPVMLRSSVDALPLLLSVAGAVAICWTIWQVVSSLRGRRHS